MINLMKEQTNLYARQSLAKLRSTNSLSPKSRYRLWNTVTQSDIKSFLAIFLHMCVSQRPSIRDHWCTEPVYSCNFCPHIMSRDRFELILSFFHLNDNSKEKKKGQDGFDALFKIRPFLDHVKRKCQECFQPGEALTIDEGMCAFRGRVSFKVYMPNKPNKYGIKLYILADSETGFAWNFEIYHGKNDNFDNSGAAIVIRLLDFNKKVTQCTLTDSTPASV